MATRKQFRKLLVTRQERLASIDAFSQECAIRHHYVAAVRVAQIGVWSPWAARLIERYRDWKHGLRKMPCEGCGEIVRARDLMLYGEVDLLCSLCWVGRIWRMAKAENGSSGAAT